MKIKKTVGVFLLITDERKSYTIHTTCGNEFFAKAVGSQGYECGGIKFDTLRSVKAHIETKKFTPPSMVLFRREYFN
mgnify:CR=1 FL=1